MSRILPRQIFPSLDFPLVDGGHWSLNDQKPRTFVMLVVFRHAYCSFCRRQLKDIENHFGALVDLGVTPIAVSCDSLKRTQTLVDETGLEKLPIGYELPLSVAAPLGLYLSERNKDIEPERFFEPGTFLIDRDRKLFMTSTQNMAFGRATMRELLEAIAYAVEKKVPPRGHLDPQTLE